MADNLKTAGLLLILPTVVAFVLGVVLGQFKNAVARRFALCMPIALAFAIGYVANPDRLPLWPERHWHWLPYAALAMAAIGGISREGQWWWQRLAEFALLVATLAAAWLIVPRWDALWPTWPVMILLLDTYLLLLPRLLLALPARLHGRLELFLLAAVTLCVVVYVAAEVSLRIAGCLIPGAAALIGGWLASWCWSGEAKDVKHAIPGLLPVFAILAGGGAFVGAIELPEPRWSLLAIPAAPLMLWLFACGPLAKLQGTTAAVAQVLAVALIPIAIVAWTVLKTEPEVEWSKLTRSRPASLLNLGNRPEVEPVIGGNLAGLGPLE